MKDLAELGRTRDMAQRTIHLDVLKFIGLSLIILAHVNCGSSLVMQLRSFDVPLMVFVSGILAVQSYKKEHSGAAYIVKRVKRLLVPTYVFLTCYFFVFKAVSLVLREDFYSFATIRDSYLLLGGIGYVWIIRIYLLCALATPLLVLLFDRIGWAAFLAAVTAVYVGYEIVYSFGVVNDVRIVEYVLWYLLPYGFVLALGMVSQKMGRKLKVVCGCIGFALFGVLAAHYYELGGGLYADQ